MAEIEQDRTAVEAVALAEAELRMDAPSLEAAIHWMTGLVFALVLSGLMLFVLPATPGVAGYLREVEARGVDAAMRLSVAAHPLAPSHLPPGITGYVFLDIDPAGCAAAGVGSRCAARSPADPGLVADVASATLKFHPRVVVLDAALWDNDRAAPDANPAFARLAQAAALTPKTPILAVAPFRPTERSGLGVVDPTLIPTSLRGVVQFAPAYTSSDRSVADDVVRSYSATVGALRGGGTLQLPTLPYLAALYANNPNGENLVCLGAAPPAHCSALQRVIGLGRWADAPRLLFRLPSLAVGSDVLFLPAYVGLYDRMVLSQILGADGHLTLEASQIQGKVVVISTSAVQAMDRHQTPLGEMAGAELLLNAVNAFQTDGAIREPGLGARIGDELRLIAVCSIPVLGFWLAYFHLGQALEGRPWAQQLLSAAGASLYLLSFAVSVLFAVGLVLSSLANGLERGFDAEFFTPILALSLDGFAEASGWLVDRVELQVGRLLRYHIRPRPGRGQPPLRDPDA